jgi:hypothetical protein
VSRLVCLLLARWPVLKLERSRPSSIVNRERSSVTINKIIKLLFFNTGVNREIIFNNTGVNREIIFNNTGVNREIIFKKTLLSVPLLSRRS